MRVLSFHAVFLAVAALVSGADESPIVFPKRPAIPVPMPPAPAPSPGGVFMLSGDLLYVVESKADFALRPHPAKFVTVKKLKGPVTVFARFADGSGLMEQRNYAGPCVYAVQAAGVGTVELEAIPFGFTDESQIRSETIQVDNHGPRPPPEPEPKPPEPKPPEPTPAKTFRVIFAVESGATLTPAQQGVIYGAAVENWCLKNCTGGKDGFRRRDKDNPTVTGVELNEIWQTARQVITTTPVAIVEKNAHIEVIPVEATPEKMIAIFQEYLVGKRGK